MAETSLALIVLVIYVVTLVLLQTSAAHVVKTEVFRSPEIVLEPGLVSNKYYYNLEFPRGHIGIKSFHAELVDERETTVSLHETYLHHGLLQRYYAPKSSAAAGLNPSLISNDGVCDTLRYDFGVGAETRKTAAIDIPDPYGVRVGDPAAIPAGYKEGWLLNVHVIDTRGAEDTIGCAECRCDLYDVTVDALPPGYQGGLRCCADEKRCRVKQGFHGEKRSIYLRYIVKYVDWDSSSMVPVNIYVLDVIDDWTKADESKGIKARHHCEIEYDIESCINVGDEKNGCIDSRSVSFSFPSGGDLIYGVGHQHVGATAITLYGEGGRTICSSIPVYGDGNEAGNEAGFIVGMSACYPSPAGSVKISAGERITLVSNYSNVERHSGVMALFNLLLADSSPKSLPPLASKITTVPKFVWPIVLLGVVLVLVAVVAWKGKTGKEEGYEAML